MKYYTKTLFEYIKADQDRKAEIEREVKRKQRLVKIRSMKGFSLREYKKIISV